MNKKLFEKALELNKEIKAYENALRALNREPCICFDDSCYFTAHQNYLITKKLKKIIKKELKKLKRKFKKL